MTLAPTPPGVVLVHVGRAGWPGDGARYMAGHAFAVSKGYAPIDLALEAWAIYGYLVRGTTARHPPTLAEWRALAGRMGTDHAIPIADGYAAAAGYAIRAVLTAWGRGLTVRSVFNPADHAPPTA